MKLEIGMSAVLKKSFTQQEVNVFNQINGDTNPIHYDKEYAATTRFKQVIVPGPLTSTIFGGLLGSRLPGPGTILLSHTHRFFKPIYMDEENEYVITITDIDEVKHRVRFSVKCLKINGEIAIAGDALVIYYQ